MDLITSLGKEVIPAKAYPAFKAGDTITVHYKIKEGGKERIQPFTGVVIQIRGRGNTKTVTIRKFSDGVGVERIIPLYSPHVEKIEVTKKGKVRRARLFYLRRAKGKRARIAEQWETEELRRVPEEYSSS